MSMRKTKLSWAEAAKYIGDLKWLQARGIDLEIPPELLESSRSLEITIGRPPASLVCDVRRGGTAYYAVWVRLVAKSRVTVLDSEIKVSWDDQIVLESFISRDKLCRCHMVFTESELLNERIENGLRFPHRGHMVEGWIVATGLRPIPDEYRHGVIVPFELTFSDQFGQEISQRSQLSVSRSAKRKISAVRPGGGLNVPAELPQSYAATERDSILLKGASDPSQLHPAIGP
jgi:hypothetical protein